MSTMAVASSSLNPNAPLFIPAAYRQVEDFSPEWWELVKTTAWFRDHWFRQHHQLHDEPAGYNDDADVDVAALLPDDSVDLLDTDDLLFYAPPEPPAAKPAAYDVDVLRALGLASSPTPAVAQHQPHHLRHAQQHVGVSPTARRIIHQPR